MGEVQGVSSIARNSRGDTTCLCVMTECNRVGISNLIVLNHRTTREGEPAEAPVTLARVNHPHRIVGSTLQNTQILEIHPVCPDDFRVITYRSGAIDAAIKAIRVT